MRDGFPSRGDLVVCTVVDIRDIGVDVSLDEYRGRKGFIPIGEVAPGWIKYVRDHVREGQKVVCRVIDVDPKRDAVDLSLKSVNDHQRKEKIREWKREQRAYKILELGFKGDELDDVVRKLLEVYETLYDALEDSIRSGWNVLLDTGVDEGTARKIWELASENIRLPEARLHGFVELTCPRGDGVEVIKKALKSIESSKEGEIVTVSYVGAPRYRIDVIAQDLKKAESILERSAKKAVKIVEKAGGEGKYVGKSA